MTALYRAYRPQTFADVMGQDRAVRTLRNAITSDRVAHAYLFTGSKGTGKTTLAKLLAKAMNCEQGPTPDPCGVCESCVSIAEGRSVDVAEIDAASNTGVDDVRERIIKTVAFQPASGSRRVYILDEAHQLSAHAFNALLKTIEEPPPHALFIFCTTEAHKMMATVRDRCQRIVLAPPTPDVLLDVLTRVSATEGITADELALRTLVRSAQGSFRNALGLLEMMATAFDRSFTREDVLAHLGTFGEEVLLDLAEAILQGSAGAALEQIEDLIGSGADLAQLAVELADHLRTVLLVKHGVQSALASVGTPDRVEAQAAAADEQHILSAIDCLNDALTRIRVGTDPRIAIESAVVRACQGLGLPSLALRIAMLEHKAGIKTYGAPLPRDASVASATTSQSPPTEAPAVVSEPSAPQATPQAPAPEAAPSQPPAQSSTPSPSSSAIAKVEAALEDTAVWWPAVLGVLTDPALKVLARTAVPVRAGEGVVVVAHPVPATFQERPRQQLARAIQAVTGHQVRVEVQQADRAAEEPAASSAERVPVPSLGDEQLSRAEVDELAELAAAEPEPETARAVPAARDAVTAMVSTNEAGAADAAEDKLALFQATFNATEVPDA